MRNKWALLAVFALAVQTGFASGSHADASGADRTTKYRVYQNDNALKEFAAEAGAVAYAKGFSYSHVEQISGRQWIWDNFPRYKVYENGYSTGNREFKTLSEAKIFASKLRFAQIRDLEYPGWIQASLPSYQLFQGDRTLPDWTFATLAEAKKAGKAYANVHIVELASNQWVWDNLTPAQKEAQRKQTPVYDIMVDGNSTGEPLHAFLLDAMRAAATTPGSVVVNMSTGLIVHSNIPSFGVVKNGQTLRSFYSIGGAINYAKQQTGVSIVKDGRVWWTNAPYLSVLQNGNLLRQFHTRQAAVAYASAYSNASVITEDSRSIWNNNSNLQYWAWNGTSSTSTVLDQIGATQGLDYDSPTWFELAAADGTLNDSSDPSLVSAMTGAGTQIVPLAHNQFDRQMTSAFLRDPQAQSHFIAALVDRLSQLGVQGVNLDFESVAGSDRDRFTAFVRSLTEAAHQKGLTVSIDLIRGDVRWDAQTAYDHQALADIVDSVMIMAYDQHYEGGGEAGSVGELAWVEEGIKQFLAYGFPRSKVVLGIPFYIRDWTVDASGKPLGSKAIFMKEVPRLVQSTQAQGVYDATAGQMKYTYVKDGYTHLFWAETSDTIKARIELAKTYDLAGIAAWRLGYEDEDLWTMMLHQK